MVQRTSLSLKRRRSWLEIGFAGCSLLASPAEAAWPSFGSIWSSSSHRPAEDHHLRAQVPRARQRGDHHGTHPAAGASAVPSFRSLGLPPAYQPPHQRRRQQEEDEQHPSDHVGSSPALHTSVEDTPPLRSPPMSTRARALEVEIAVHGRHGDWQACSADTCTQTRLVFCETRDSRVIVADDLCGDELPDAEQPCSDEAAAAVCGSDAAAPSGVAGRDGRQGAGATSKAAGVATRGVEGKRADTDVSKNGVPSSSPSAAAGNMPQEAPPAAAGSRGVRGPKGTRVGSSSSTAREVGHEATSKTSGTTSPVEDGVASRARGEGDTREGTEGSEAADAPVSAAAAAKKASGATAEAREENERGAAHDRNKSTETSSPAQDEAGNKRPADAPHDEEPSPPVLARIGGTASKSSREEYRFWVVLAIGAGAVGSFVAVVVFAVGQYRKEQHRLRGIMALNEFPQDNYINPFARQLSSELQLSADDRSAFKL